MSSNKNDAYNEKLCDERHETINTRLKEMRVLLYSVLGLTAASLFVGIAKFDPDAVKTAISIMIKLRMMIGV